MKICSLTGIPILLGGLISLGGCAIAPKPFFETTRTTVLVVIDDPRPARIRSLNTNTGYVAPIQYDSDPILKRRSAAIANDYENDVLAEWPLRSINVHCFVINKPDLATLKKMTTDPRIKWIQPFNTHHVQSTRRNSAGLPYIEQLRFGGDATGSRITLIDTGADISHLDLSNSRIEYLDMVAARKGGKSESHGTSVLGLIAASPVDADSPVKGLAFNAEVQHLRACWEVDGQGQCNTLTLALALDATSAHNPHILNLSLSGPKDRVLDALLDQLTARGTVVVSAFDESRDFNQRFPSPAPGVLYAQGADSPIPFEVGGDPQVIQAPLHAISLSPMNAYGLVSGHSVATPHITALLATLRSKYPDVKIDNLLKSLADHLQTH